MRHPKRFEFWRAAGAGVNSVSPSGRFTIGEERRRLAIHSEAPRVDVRREHESASFEQGTHTGHGLPNVPLGVAFRFQCQSIVVQVVVQQRPLFQHLKTLAGLPFKYHKSALRSHDTKPLKQ
jgi:hypothetical protein